MGPKTKRTAVEAKIARLESEIAEIDRSFYYVNATEDRELYAGMLERKRDDMVRCAVLQLHTAIEDVLTSFIICRSLGMKPEEGAHRVRSKKAKALRKRFRGQHSVGFYEKVKEAIKLHLISESVEAKLLELNKLRNTCSHNWLLNVPLRQGIGPNEKKPRLLSFRGRDLHKVSVLEGFTGEFGVIYSKLFVKYLDG